MRTIPLFSSVDASVNQTSATFSPDCFQDMRWSLSITYTGLDAQPKIVIEVSINESDWCALINPEDCEEFFLLDDELHIRDEYFPEKFFRIRLEPNGNTTGTVSALLGYKTYSN